VDCGVGLFSRIPQLVNQWRHGEYFVLGFHMLDRLLEANIKTIRLLTV